MVIPVTISYFIPQSIHFLYTYRHETTFPPLCQMLLLFSIMRSFIIPCQKPAMPSLALLSPPLLLWDLGLNSSPTPSSLVPSMPPLLQDSLTQSLSLCH